MPFSAKNSSIYSEYQLNFTEFGNLIIWIFTTSFYFSTCDKGMNIAAIILLIDDPKEILKRLNARDKSALDVAVIESLQRAEADRATRVASFLSIPLLESQIYDMTAMLSWIKDTIQHPAL